MSPVPRLACSVVALRTVSGHLCAMRLTGKSKCMSKSGDCVVKHPSAFATGLQLVVGNVMQPSV